MEPVTEMVEMSLVMEIEAGRLREFFPLLQKGVSVSVRVGSPLADLLSREWEIPPDYVTARISTIFLDGRAIDDVNSAIIRAGSVLALSGAMPGLVGATMRRGGYYAAMRGGITYRETAAEVAHAIAPIRLKLFNILLPELGPLILNRGIMVTWPELSDLLESASVTFREGRSLFVDEVSLDREALQSRVREKEGGIVHLAVRFKG